MTKWSIQYKSPKWQKKRLEVLKHYGFKCSKCGSESEQLHVHHTHYKSGRKVWEYNVEDLVCLCKSCHESEHNIVNDKNSSKKHVEITKPTGRTQSFYSDEASKYGINEAVVLNFVRSFLILNQKNGHNIRDGRVWVYMTAKEMSERIEYLSKPQVARATASLVKRGVLVSGCFNRVKYDRTLWYSINEESIQDVLETCNNKKVSK